MGSEHHELRALAEAATRADRSDSEMLAAMRAFRDECSPSTVLGLLGEIEAERKRSAEMHRRAQANDGAAERYASLHAEYVKAIEGPSISRLRERVKWVSREYRRRERGFVRKIVAAGVSNVIARRDDGTPSIVDGHPDRMLDKMIADRDEWKRRAEAAESRIAELEAQLAARPDISMEDAALWLDFRDFGGGGETRRHGAYHRVERALREHSAKGREVIP